MISPARSRIHQQRTLIRTPDLRAFRRTLVELALIGDPLEARRRAVILPTRAAAELFRQTIEDDLALHGNRRAIVLPELLTRDEWVARLHQCLPGDEVLLTRFEREVLLERAARLASGRARPPFKLRPGLIGAMLDFYDELQRRGRTTRRFVTAIANELCGRKDTDDRGATELARQTAFLAWAFRGYERGRAKAGALDEHLVRKRLLGQGDLPLPFAHVIVAVADRPSDLRGLWPADFDLLGRLAAFERIDVVVTDETHDSGFRERVEQELPGLVEVRSAQRSAEPTLLRPPAGSLHPLCAVSRDREEELREVVRAVLTASGGEASSLSRTAVVFQRPLPYLYLAHQIMADAGVPCQAFDALPLAGEPASALLDLVLAFARTGGTREAAAALLRSPLLRFEVDGQELAAADASALDAVLMERRTTGEASEYVDEVSQFFGERAARDGISAERARRAAVAAASCGRLLGPFRDSSTPASIQLQTLSQFLRRHEREPAEDADWRTSYRRARAAVLSTLDGLADACAGHDDHHRPPHELAATIRHWIETQTFTPHRGSGGLHLVDAVAARFGEFDHVHLVGLVDADWPERPRRSMFYTTGLLTALGWPADAKQRAAQNAAFRDLLRLPARALRLHAFQLEGDAIVGLSPVLESARSLPFETFDARPVAVFADEILTVESPDLGCVDADTKRWLAARQARPDLAETAYRGHVAPQPPREYRVTSVDTYVKCPFKYFAAVVLGLGEEAEEDSGLTPRERGVLVHRLFERFYQQWEAQGGGAITRESLARALALFERVASTELARLSPADRALEETRLLGSVVGRGFAERVFEIEIEADRPIARRLLERSLLGPFPFPSPGGGACQIALRGKADRIDVFQDGSLRVIDYKLTAPPKEEDAIQIQVYGHAARHLLEAEDGRSHPVSEAAYVSFGDDWEAVKRVGENPAETESAIEAGAERLARFVSHIESGRFEPSPADLRLCEWCAYARLCRRESVIERSDEDRATESV